MILFPNFMQNYFRYKILSYSILISQFLLGITSRVIKIPYLFNFCSIKLSRIIRFSWIGLKMGIVSALSSLIVSIYSVIFMSSEKQMVRINAARIVTSVANAKTTWYNPLMKLIRNSVSPEIFFVSPKSTVPVFVFMTSPFPTRVLSDNFYFVPKGLHTTMLPQLSYNCQGGY